MKKKTAGRDAKLVSRVRELLPHLEDAFIEVCVQCIYIHGLGDFS